jgi:hypothetical protein
MKYIDLTPRWVEILPTWLMMYRQAVEGDCSNPDLILNNARDEFTRMATAADNYGDLIAWLKLDGWSNEQIGIALAAGRAASKRERNTVKESDDA